MFTKITSRSIIFVRAVILFALSLVIIGILFSGYDIYKWVRFRLHGTKVEAIIEKCSKQKISKVGSPWKGIMRWELQYTGIYGFDVVDASGNKTHFTGTFSFTTDYHYDWEVNPEEYKVGSTVQVVYLPFNPWLSMPLDELTNSKLAILLGIFIVLLTIALALFAVYYHFYKGKTTAIQK